MVVDTSVRLVTDVVVSLETLSGQFTAPAASECSPWVGTFVPASFVAQLTIAIGSTPHLLVDPGSPSDRWTTTCRGIPASFEGVWREAWMGFHSNALVATSGGDFFLFTDGDGWQVTPGQSVFATLMYDQVRSLRDGLVHEATSMTLRHVPQ